MSELYGEHLTRIAEGFLLSKINRQVFFTYQSVSRKLGALEVGFMYWFVLI